MITTAENWLVVMWDLAMFDLIDECYDDKSDDDGGNVYLASGY